MITEWEAAKALLESVGLSGRVRDAPTDDKGEVVRADYVVLYGAGPDELGDGRYGVIPRPESDADYEFCVRGVSGDPRGVRLLMEKVLLAVGRKPVVPGRRTDPVTIAFENAKVDHSVSPPLHFQDAWLKFTSRRG
ncbi:hypothetical protein [Leucobacter sp. M11]|uniref:hypothetical protein n=1 Tax=Leucobacter sp. M11 TaxID=2993565 RepID=UPI002D80C4DE|nr:hypothetical protein [Leucobacter sp. M11]MEB4613997.1 hypothetical protein [Leucobacter sp. M11]